MTGRGSTESAHPLAASAGEVLLSGPQALLKGLLEAELPVAVLAVSDAGPLGALPGSLSVPAMEVLRAHELRLVRALTAERALAVAMDAARTDRAAMAVIENGALGGLRASLAEAAMTELPRDAAAVLLVENAPRRAPAACPVRAARELDVPCMVAASVTHLRDLAEPALLMSRAARKPVILVTHARIFSAMETLSARPNRMGDSVDSMIARRWTRVRTRRSEAADPLRLVRRLELNRVVGLPSPGERVPLGFITVGPAQGALEHLLNAFNLVGRVPHMTLVATTPTDAAAIERVLQRCERVIVLEARPGSSQSPVLTVAEQLHRRGLPAASIWCRSVPEAGAEGEELPVLPDDAVHPSRLARLLVRSLHTIRPSARIERLLTPSPPALPAEADPGPRAVQADVAAALHELARHARRAERLLHQRAAEDEGAAGPVPQLLIGGMTPTDSGGARSVPVEITGAEAFESAARAMIRHAAQERSAWIILVADVGERASYDPLRLARGLVPAEAASRVRLEEASFAARAELVALIAELAASDHAAVVVVRDPAPSRFRRDQRRTQAVEVDRLGYEPHQRAEWSLERSCAVRESSDTDMEREAGDAPEADAAARARWRMDWAPRIWRSAPRFYVRPLREEVEVRRVRPPIRSRSMSGSGRLPVPEFLHRRAALWRVHLAGCRGAGPGPVAIALLHAGGLMEYAIRAEIDGTEIDVGRHAWTQIAFSRPSSVEFAAPIATGRIPFGEADLVIGLDPRELLRALGSDPDLRVADPGRTAIIADLSSAAEVRSETGVCRHALLRQIEALSLATARLTGDYRQLSRRWFRTDRLVDVLLLGTAYQMGFVPISQDAMEQGLSAAENAGFARSREAFDLGRRAAIDPALLARGGDGGLEEVPRIARRLERLLHRRGSRSARRAAAALEKAMVEMPGLRETDAGRQALRDFLSGFSRAHVWGGAPCAEAFVERVVRLYHADRGETGRQLTRAAILPLAVATLMLDPVYLASMATSAEHRRRTRHRLDVHPSRGDELERRYISHVEFFALGLRVRGVVRTSDWPSRIAWRLRDVVPGRLRGTRRDRALRDLVVKTVERAIGGASDAYTDHLAALTLLHELVQSPRWRSISPQELQRLLGVAALGAAPNGPQKRR